MITLHNCGNTKIKRHIKDETNIFQPQIYDLRKFYKSFDILLLSECEEAT